MLLLRPVGSRSTVQTSAHIADTLVDVPHSPAAAAPSYHNHMELELAKPAPINPTAARALGAAPHSTADLQGARCSTVWSAHLGASYNKRPHVGRAACPRAAGHPVRCTRVRLLKCARTWLLLLKFANHANRYERPCTYRAVIGHAHRAARSAVVNYPSPVSRTEVASRPRGDHASVHLAARRAQQCNHSRPMLTCGSYGGLESINASS